MNGRSIVEFAGITTVKAGKRNQLLDIESVSAEHSGNFTCIAKNKAGTVSYTTDLHVNGTRCDVLCISIIFNFPNEILIYSKYSVLPRIVPFSFEDGPASSGQDITVTCTVPEGDLPIDISWYLNGKSIVEYGGITSSKVGKRNLVLNIESVAAEHSGNFTCSARNKAGSVSSTTDLKVYGSARSHPFRMISFCFQLIKRMVSVCSLVLPRIVPFSFEDGPASSGQDITVTCTVPEGDLPIDINWYLDNKSISHYGGITSARFGKRNLVLNIESVAAEHSGNYTCLAKNKAGAASYTTDLKVFGDSLVFNHLITNTIVNFYSFNPIIPKVLPRIAPFAFEEGPAQTGQSISLTCSVVDGDLPLYINWFLNDQPTEDISGLTQGKIGRRISVLSIESVQADHAGQYSCRAINKAGQTESSAELKVNGIEINGISNNRLTLLNSTIKEFSFILSPNALHNCKIQNCPQYCLSRCRLRPAMRAITFN